MKQKTLFIVLLLISALLLFACQDNQAEDNSDSSLSGAALTNREDPTATPAESEPAEVAPIEQAGEGEASESTTETVPVVGLPNLQGAEVRIAVENAYLPFNYINLETGEADGWDYAVVDDICERLNCTPVWVELPWDETVTAVRSGQVDIAGGGLTITEERAQAMVFSTGCISVEQRMLTRDGEDRFTNAAEFAADSALILGVFEYVGDANYPTAIELVGEDRLQTYDSFAAAEEALLAGEVDALIIDDVENGIELDLVDNVMLLDDSLASAELAFAFTPESEFIEPFNAAIAEMVEDGSLAGHNQTWFGPTFDMSYDNIGAGAYATP